MSRLRTIIVFFSVLSLSLMSSTIAKATSQVGERFIYNGDTIEISTQPLYTIAHDVESILKERYGLDMFEEMALAIARGYIGTWEFKDGKLYLIKLSFTSFKGISLQDIFGDKCIDGRVLADWFSGRIVIPKGKWLVYDGFSAHTYCKEEHLFFKKGILRKTKQVNNYITVPGAISRRYNQYFSYSYYNDEDDYERIDLEKLKVRQAIINCLNLHKQELKKKIFFEGLMYHDPITVTIGPEGLITEVWFYGEKNNYLKKLLQGLRFDIIRFRGKKYSERIHINFDYDGEYLYLDDDDLWCP